MKILDEKGAAAVEFAIILTLLVVLVFGIVEFGLLLYNKHIITNASREGARAGIVAQLPRLTLGEIETVVNAYCAAHLITFGSATNPETTIDNSMGTSFGDDLIVTVTYQYGFLLLPNFITGLGEGINLSAETVMKYE